MDGELEQTLLELLQQAEINDDDLTLLKGFTFAGALGEGGMGAVYLLCDQASGEHVALKLMRLQLTPDERARKLFRREIASAMALNHKNIVKFRGSGSSGHLLFLLMDFCDRGSVATKMRCAGGKLPRDEAVDITFQALNGLAYANQVRIPDVELSDGSTADAIGLVHRDLKPDNLFLASAEEGQVVKIGDFGLAKAFQTSGLSGYTITGEARGTPQFMPRQQVIDYKYSGPEVDAWAIIACLYNMLTGWFPRDFSTDDPWHTVLYSPIVPIRNRDGSIPPALAKVIDQALDDSGYELPFSSATELQLALKSALS